MLTWYPKNHDNLNHLNTPKDQVASDVLAALEGGASKTQSAAKAAATPKPTASPKKVAPKKASTKKRAAPAKAEVPPKKKKTSAPARKSSRKK